MSYVIKNLIILENSLDRNNIIIRVIQLYERFNRVIFFFLRICVHF